MAAVDETPVAVATEAPQAEQAPSAMEVSEEKAATEVAPAAAEQQAEAPEEKSGEPEAAPEAAPEERATETMAADAPAASEEAAQEEASKEEAPEAAPRAEVQADAEPKAMEVEEPATKAQETVEAATAAAEASPEAAVAAEAQAEGAPKAEAQGEAKAATKATPGASAGAKRKRGSTISKEVPLEALAGKIKRLQEEASEAEAEVVALVAEKARMLAEIDARISKKRIEAEAKRVIADNGGKEYIKKQCEAALAQLESDVPKRPKTIYLLFSEDVRQSDALKECSFAEKAKKMAEMWAAVDEAGKQKYVDHYEAAKKRYAEWGSSEEGRKNLSERSELLRKVKAEGMEELNSALAAVGSSSPAPAKRTTEASAMETPPKQRRATPAKVEPASKADPVLDEKVLAEATSAELLSQLRNLVARPEVLALGKTSQELLDVLKAKNGMVNAAKNALLSA